MFVAAQKHTEEVGISAGSCVTDSLISSVSTGRGGQHGHGRVRRRTNYQQVIGSTPVRQIHVLVSGRLCAA